MHACCATGGPGQKSTGSEKGKDLAQNASIHTVQAKISKQFKNLSAHGADGHAMKLARHRSLRGMCTVWSL